MFGKKKDKDQADKLDVFDVQKIYVNGIPGGFEEADARDIAAEMVQEKVGKLPVIGRNDKLPNSPSIRLSVEGQRLIYNPEGSHSFEWLIIAGVFTPCEKKE